MLYSPCVSANVQCFVQCKEIEDSIHSRFSSFDFCAIIVPSKNRASSFFSFFSIPFLSFSSSSTSSSSSSSFFSPPFSTSHFSIHCLFGYRSLRKSYRSLVAMQKLPYNDLSRYGREVHGERSDSTFKLNVESDE